MILRTSRMILRKLSGSDVRDLYALDQDTEVRRYIDDGKPPEPWPAYQQKTLQKIESFSTFGEDLGFWSARFPEGTFIGWFHLRPNSKLFPGEMEIGYRLRRDCWGKGLATEGVQKLLDHALSKPGLVLRYGHSAGRQRRLSPGHGKSGHAPRTHLRLFRGTRSPLERDGASRREVRDNFEQGIINAV